MKNKVLLEIKRRFKTSNGYCGSWDSTDILCPQVNGLVNICLTELGFEKETEKNLRTFLQSPSFDKKTGLFYREVDLDGNVVVPNFNVCKNAVFALSLAPYFSDEAKIILGNLKNSPAYLVKSKLYGREFNTFQVNPLIITQSNLWMALAYSKLGLNKETEQIVHALEKNRFQQGLFNSQDCRGTDYKTKFFLDDQALAILAYIELGQQEKAKQIIGTTINNFYDSKMGLFNSSTDDNVKSTYKNSLMAQSLAKLDYKEELINLQKGLVRELYDSKERLFNQTTIDSTKVPDNSALALVTLNYR
jgi:hypothetical protein